MHEKRIGVDESGKGDYFGYLVIAAAAVDAAIEKKLRELGVKDSKKLSDYAAKAMATKIRKICKDKFTIVEFSPETYNKRYRSFGHNLNKMLAWGHAKAIENLLGKNHADVAISDKFEDDGLLKKALMEKGRKIKLIQRVRAEDDTAVAAASVIARAEFLRTLKRLSVEVGVVLPKGAAHVDAAINELKEKYDEKTLEKIMPMIAKMHFKITKRVMKK